jgi:phage FluMu gp28-like protein
VQLLEWLSRPVNYAENLIRVAGGPVRLDPWQNRFLRDDSKFINILKSRRVGGSWVMTLKMFISAQLTAGYSGTFVSMNLEEAKGRIEYADQMYESLPRRFRKKRVARSRTELVFEDSRGRRSVLRSLASRAPRGKGGDVCISELPHCLNSREIYEGALHVTSRSVHHNLTIESTPLGKRGVFYDICRGKFPQFTLYEVPWWHCGALCTDIERALKEAPELSTRERVDGFGTPSMRAIFASMTEDGFRQESELAFIETADCVFPMELLEKNCTAAFGADAGGSLRFVSLKNLPALSDWRWLEKNIKGSLVAGYDVGRKNDEAVLFVLDDLSHWSHQSHRSNRSERLEARMMVRLSDTGFSAQESLLCEAMRRGVRRMAIDSTGIGMPVAEKLAGLYGERVMPVHFTAAVKERLVANTKLLLMDKKLTLPLERNILAQMQSVEKQVTGSGNVVYSAPRGDGNHADIAWAIMLACHAARESVTGELHYESLSGRPGMSSSNRSGWALHGTLKNIGRW